MPPLLARQPPHTILLPPPTPTHPLSPTLAAETESCTAKLERAEKLIKGLGGEKARWASRPVRLCMHMCMHACPHV